MPSYAVPAEPSMVPTQWSMLSPSGNADTPGSPPIISAISSDCSRRTTDWPSAPFPVPADAGFAPVADAADAAGTFPVCDSWFSPRAIAYDRVALPFSPRRRLSRSGGRIESGGSGGCGGGAGFKGERRLARDGNASLFCCLVTVGGGAAPGTVDSFRLSAASAAALTPTASSSASRGAQSGQATACARVRGRR